MILYFSGTGNSAYTAEKIGRNIQDGSVNLFKKIRTHDYTEICSDTPWVIVSPTYAWRLPRILSDWLEKTNLTGSRDIYFVLTCGQNIGNAGAYAQKLCEKKGMNFLGCMPVVMPENFMRICSCPKEAVEYGKHSKGQVRYTCPKR